MTRQARKKSETGIYHIVMRGIDRQLLFLENADKKKFLDIVRQKKSEMEFSLYAYALMDNHIHLLIRESDAGISTEMQMIGTSYACWHNKKHERVGHLFQDRFFSKPVSDDTGLLEVVRYIHRNPVKIGRPMDEWTSYREYLGAKDIVDTEMVLAVFCADISDRSRAVELFSEYMNNAEEAEKESHLDARVLAQINDLKALDIVRVTAGVNDVREVLEFSAAKRRWLIRRLKESGLSDRQIARVSGWGRGVVARAQE